MITKTQLRAFIAAAASNETLYTDLTTERDRLALELINNPESASEIISGSGGGTAFTGQVNMTKTARLDYLQLIIETIDRGEAPHSTSYARFW